MKSADTEVTLRSFRVVESRSRVLRETMKHVFCLITKVILCILTTAFPLKLTAQAKAPPVTYTLVDGSHLVDDCPVCDRVAIIVPLRGTFQLRLVSQDPLFANYAVENLSFAAASTNGPQYTVVGDGSYRIGGEVGFFQELSLKVTIDDGATTSLCFFTNTLALVDRPWPMLQASVDQSNGTFVQQFHLDLNAAPFRELWFSTTRPFKVPGWNAPTNLVSAGDLLSSGGRIVKHNADLTGLLGIQPIVPDLGLKSVSILPGGETAFSIEQDVFSETLGPLHHGDLLSDRGQILRTNQQLLSAFVPESTAQVDFGLDSVQLLDTGEIYLSTQTNFVSTKLARTIQRGDLLSDSGAIIKSNAELIAAFNPLITNTDFGLKAVYAWPSGEEWFSTEDGFYGGSNSNYYSPGDLLSDHGYVVFHNNQLLSPWNGPESTNDFGLDALFVVSDVILLPPSAGQTRLASPLLINVPPASLLLQWTRGGRVFQLEKATDAAGPYQSITPIITEGSFLEPSGQTNTAQAFYRVHKW
jgi:hypothetical protein